MEGISATRLLIRHFRDQFRRLMRRNAPVNIKRRQENVAQQRRGYPALRLPSFSWEEPTLSVLLAVSMASMRRKILPSDTRFNVEVLWVGAHSRQRQRNGRAIFRIEAEHDLIISALIESRILTETDGKAV
jgi:hypothetical protein